jgi:hypothetical protein
MLEALINILLPLTGVLVLVFLTLRLRFFGDDRVTGRWPFLIGGILLVIAAVWFSVARTSAYAEWFIPSVYPWLEFRPFSPAARRIVPYGQRIGALCRLVANASGRYRGARPETLHP